jgi:uncharacterized SAM-binding protein YcdF (DUF218 family)
MAYTLQRILSELLLPPFGFTLLLFLGTLLCLRHRRTGLAIATTALLLQLATGIAALNPLLSGPPPPVPARVAPPYPPAEAIVVLGGGRYLDAPEYGGDTAGPSTLERARYAAKLHRETGLPILVSGGKPGNLGTRSEAEILRHLLEDEFGVPVRWVEDRSQETAENARYSAALLRRDGIATVMLVTHGHHMPRAHDAFAETGLAVVPMTTGFLRPEALTVFSWTPSAHGLWVNRVWLYETLAALKP